MSIEKRRKRLKELYKEIKVIQEEIENYTIKEVDILELLRDGYTIHKIACSLGTSIGAVYNAFRKNKVKLGRPFKNGKGAR